MALSESQKKFLRGLGHRLKPVVTVGDGGVSAALLQELDNTLEHHELVKVKVRAADREARDAAIGRLCDAGPAELVARVGNVALLWRRNEEAPKIVLLKRS